MANIIREPCDDGTIQSAGAATPCPPNVAPWVLAATILGSSMAFIDGTVVNVALPAIQRDLNATVADAQWVVEAYALFLAALLLIGGSLGDHLGRRRVFTAGVALFAVASIGCGIAQDAPQLVIARAVQGVGGALLVPGSLAIISASFAGSDRGRAIGTWSAASAITTAIGPVLGGWLVENLSWRWAFLINVPLAVAVIAIAVWRVPESRDPTAGSLDWWGAILATTGLGGLVFGLIELPLRGPGDLLVLGSLAAGVVGLVVFVLRELRTPSPMVPPSLFRSRTFTGANLLTVLLYGALGGALFFVPFNLIQVQGYTATAAGAALLPVVLLLSGLSRWAGGLVDRYGARPPLVIGPAIAGVGFALFALPGIGGSYWTTVFPAATVLGLGMATAVAPLTTTVMNAVSDEHAGTASGVNNAASRVAGLLAIAVLGIVITAVFERGLDDRLPALDAPPEAIQTVNAQRDRLAGIELPATIDPTTGQTLERAINESYVAGFRLVMLIAAGLAFASALTAALTIADRPHRAGTV